MAVRCVPEELWECWSKVLTDAATMATSERDAVLEGLYGEMESQLLVGDYETNRLSLTASVIECKVSVTMKKLF